jgi:DNA helicase-2/ATP-dependent DNA helicase PcrA
MFIWSSDELNIEQTKAVKEENSLLLIACPGSGKTRTLTYKVAYELDKIKSSKQFVIAITYTNRAADEIKERVENLGVDTSQLWIGTIHGFCLEWILKPYSLLHTRLKNGFKILNSHESETIITELCKPYKSQKVTYWDCGFVAKPNGYELTCLEKEKHETIQTILKEYFKELKNNHQIDFEQILYYSYKLLSKHSIISSTLSKIFPYILIDEYQDTKEIQYNIICSIINAGKGNCKTLIVGDPNQSIYDSLGGYPMPKNDIESLIGFNLKEYSLELNYRSSSKIINYFDFFKTYNNSIIPSGILKDFNSIITYNNSISYLSLEEEIVRLIQISINVNGISPNEICILAPQWIYLAGLTRNLMVRLPQYSFDGPGMAPFSRDIDNFYYKLTRIVLTEPSPNMYIRRLRWSKEILNELSDIGVSLLLQPKDFLKICNSIELNEQNGLAYLALFFDQIFKQLNINRSTFSALEEHHTSFFNSSKARIDRLNKEGHQFINSIANFRKVFKQRDGITISSIHGSKGEEYDTVIAFAMLEDLVPHFNDNNGQVNAKKMLYVLSSRAKKYLHLLSEKDRSKNKYRPDGYLPTIQLTKHNYNYDVL